MSLAPLSVRARLWAWAVVLRPLKHVVPLGTLVRLARARPARVRSEPFERSLEAYLNARETFPRRAPANCLERSLGAYRLLCEAGARPELVVGLRRMPDGRLDGHVWITVDGRPLAEAAGSLDGFVTMVSYDADARPRTPGGGTPDLAGVRLA